MSATATEGPSPFTSRKQQLETQLRGNIAKEKLAWLDVTNMAFKYLRHVITKQELGEAQGTAGKRLAIAQLKSVM